MRVLIPALAILQSLLAYPVAGSQLRLGPILLVVCGAICVADGEHELVGYARSRGGGLVASRLMTAFVVALAVGTTFEYVVEPLQANRNLYRSYVALDIPGASRLHLATPEAAILDSITAMIRQRCSSLIGMPGLYSFDIWSGVPSPSPMTGEQPWWKNLTAAQQRTLMRLAKASPRLCLIQNPTEAATYDAGGTIPTSSARRLVGAQFHTGARGRALLPSKPDAADADRPGGFTRASLAMRVLVTGGAGFIGANAAVGLAARTFGLGLGRA